MPGLHFGMARHGVAVFLSEGLSVIGGRVATHQSNVARDQVFAGANTKARLTRCRFRPGCSALLGRHLRIYPIAPAIAVTGVQEHAVTRLRLGCTLLLQDAFDISLSDH